ncbi:NUMOD4 domain-containing protein [Bacillus cytotoxicus]|uniref:NUMOD4 domain-containing protein n=1 Tax=Bacillus cytotoxicus TaxID=580165 RepID=UPI00211AC87B|nr:NUMOD4 domain-containing protein [Bacillus cytotoxicus]
METWKDIEGFEGFYQVSNLGKIRSLDRYVPKRNGQKQFFRGKIISTYINNSGYECVDLARGGKKVKNTVHRLVAKHFCKGYREKLDVNHIDADRLNNKAENLEWMSRIENIRDCIKRGTHNVDSAHKIAREKNQKPVAMLDLDGNVLRTFPSIKEAREQTGAIKIGEVCNGNRRMAGGYKWRFISKAG